MESGVPQIPTNWFYLLSFLRDRVLKPPPDYYDQPAHPWPPRDTNISWKGNCRCKSRSITSSHLESPGAMSSSWKQDQGHILGVRLGWYNCPRYWRNPQRKAMPTQFHYGPGLPGDRSGSPGQKSGQQKRGRAGKGPGNPEGWSWFQEEQCR